MAFVGFRCREGRLLICCGGKGEGEEEEEEEEKKKKKKRTRKKITVTFSFFFFFFFSIDSHCVPHIGKVNNGLVPEWPEGHSGDRAGDLVLH